MNKLRATLVFTVLTVIGSAIIFLSSCRNNSPDGMIIFTRMAGEPEKIQNDTSINSSQSQIVTINPQKPENSLKVLTNNYFSACSPVISYDGNHLLFSGKLKQNDSWQIWEMNLGDQNTRRITNTDDNCAFPAYLPDDRIVFSKYVSNDTLKAGYSLFTCNPDGTNLQRITFDPASYLASDILNDGRVLTIGSQIYPEQGKRMLKVLRPDGTKSGLFYDAADSYLITSTPRETTDRRIVFVERQKDSNGRGVLISIGYNRPLHSRLILSPEVPGDFLSVFPQSSGKLLVSYRKSQSDKYSLFEFDAENKVLGKAIYSDNGYNVLEAVVSGKHDRPKKLPSEVDTGVKTGLLLCQDVNVLNTQSTDQAIAKSYGIQIVGIDSILGRVDVESDGSFYLKVMADKPFRIQTIDKDGHVRQNTCGWISLRPNERRGCVGCHEDPEMVPGNSVPLSVKKSPVNIPMHINKVVEKNVSLE